MGRGLGLNSNEDSIMTEEYKVYVAHYLRGLNIPNAHWQPDALPFTYFRDKNSNILAFIPPQPESKQ